MVLEKKCKKIAEALDNHYPGEIQFLKFNNEFELLICVILSAQTTDEQVMKAAPALFARFPDPEALAQGDIGEIEELIRTTGFFHSKAKNIKGTAAALIENHGGRVPGTIEELVKLPGVGRKTANVVVGTLFDSPAVIVDTHFKRVTYRLGLTSNTDPDKVEQDIRKLLPSEYQYRFSMTANLHGRKCCHARKPECGECILSGMCSYFSSLR